MFNRSYSKQNNNYSTDASFAPASCNAFKFNILNKVGTVVIAVSIFVLRLINIIIISNSAVISKSKSSGYLITD